MPLARWKKISETILLKNNWWTYKRDEYELPSGKRGEYNYVFTNGSSMIVPVTSDGNVLMVKQYRYLNERDSLEFPCGSVKDGSTHDETARHELAEETGWSSEEMLIAGEFNPFNGVTSEICQVFIARNLVEAGSAPDETEEFELQRFLPGEIEEKIRSGEIWDGMTIAAWHIAKSQLEVE